MSILPARLFPQSPQPIRIRERLARAFRALARVSRPVVIIRRQPEPVEVRVCYAPNGSYTTVFRRWPKGATGPGGACHRCPSCYSRGDACLMMAPGFVSRAEARDYSPDRAGHRLTPM